MQGVSVRRHTGSHNPERGRAQHQDGHSHVLAGTIPNCVTYDPTFSYELAVIIRHGLKTMFVDKEAKFFYITLMNENYAQPEMPEG